MKERGGDVVEWLKRLVAMPTHNPGGDELALCRLLADALDGRGADEVIVEEVPHDDGTPGAYVYTRWGEPRLLVNAHIDTVPVNRGWSRDPFDPLVDGET